MVITQQPGAINFSGNLVDILITNDMAITVKLLQDGVEILEEVYAPDADDKIRIQLKGLIDSLLYLQVPPIDQPLFIQDKAFADFELNINDGEETITFKVVKGGIDSDFADTEVFLQTNFLTWQPQIKEVQFYDPEWLTYYAAEADLILKVKGYFADDTSAIVNLQTLIANKTQSISLNPGTIRSFFTADLIGFDVYVQKGAEKLTFTQRYINSSTEYQFNDIFVFENSLGGVDAVRFIGELEEKPNIQTNAALFDELTIEYNSQTDSVYQKNTGNFKSDREKVWAMDFFKSINRYYNRSGAITRIAVSKADISKLKAELESYSFSFSCAKEPKYLNLARPDYLPNKLFI